jgi:hypothetical protein
MIKILALILMLSSGVSSKQVLYETCDLIELNHFYDDLGRHAYDQIIFYEWSPDYRRFHVISWVLFEADLTLTLSSNKEWHSVRWRDRENKVNRELKSKLFRETSSNVDPERANKKLFDEKFRRRLLKSNQWSN